MFLNIYFFYKFIHLYQNRKKNALNTLNKR